MITFLLYLHYIQRAPQSIIVKIYGLLYKFYDQKKQLHNYIWQTSLYKGYYLSIAFLNTKAQSCVLLSNYLVGTLRDNFAELS